MGLNAGEPHVRGCKVWCQGPADRQVALRDHKDALPAWSELLLLIQVLLLTVSQVCRLFPAQGNVGDQVSMLGVCIVNHRCGTPGVHPATGSASSPTPPRILIPRD